MDAVSAKIVSIAEEDLPTDALWKAGQNLNSRLGSTLNRQEGTPKKTLMWGSPAPLAWLCQSNYKDDQ